MHVYWINLTELPVREKQPESQRDSFWKKEGKLREFLVSSFYFLFVKVESSWFGFATLISIYCVTSHGDWRFIYKQVSYFSWMEMDLDDALLDIWGQERSLCYQELLFSRKTCISETVHGVNASHFGGLTEERWWVRGIEERGPSLEKSLRKRGGSWLGSHRTLEVRVKAQLGICSERSPLNGLEELSIQILKDFIGPLRRSYMKNAKSHKCKWERIEGFLM